MFCEWEPTISYRKLGFGFLVFVGNYFGFCRELFFSKNLQVLKLFHKYVRLFFTWKLGNFWRKEVQILENLWKNFKKSCHWLNISKFQLFHGQKCLIFNNFPQKIMILSAYCVGEGMRGIFKFFLWLFLGGLLSPRKWRVLWNHHCPSALPSVRRFSH